MPARSMILLALAALPTALAAQQPQPVTIVPAVFGTRLDVTAEGEVTRVPDQAAITAGVVTQARSAASAMSANAQRMSAAIAALRAAGIAERDIRTASVQLQPQYRYTPNQAPVLTGYQATNQVTVTFRDIARTGAVLDALVGQGINQISGPDFSLERPEAALDEARTQAMTTARARAELYARAAGMRVRRILSISEQGGGYTPPRPPVMLQMARAEQADTPVQPGEQKLTVNVAVSFELE